MGLAHTGGTRNSSTRRLRELSRELEPVTPPWWVSQPEFDSPTPSTGWWWTPKSHAHPVFLGHNHIVAEVQLRRLIGAQEKPK